MKTILIALLVLFSLQAGARNFDQEIRVKFDAQGCVKGTKLLSASNCPAENNPCKGKQDCICSGKKLKIKWKGKAEDPFEILFEDSNGSPFDANCKYKSKKDGTKQVVKCKVKANAVDGDYKYSIKVAHCPIYDPHIIIRPM